MHGRLTCHTFRGSFQAQVWGRPPPGPWSDGTRTGPQCTVASLVTCFVTVSRHRSGKSLQRYGDGARTDSQCSGASLVTRFVTVSRRSSGESLRQFEGRRSWNRSSVDSHLISYMYRDGFQTHVLGKSVSGATELEQILNAQLPHLSLVPYRGVPGHGCVPWAMGLKQIPSKGFL